MQNATLEIIDHPSTSRKVGQVTLSDGAWPGILFHDLWPDWRPYSMLIIDLVVAGEAPLDINVRVHDRIHEQGDQAYKDRFNLTNRLRPGPQTLRISIDEIRNAPEGRIMELSQIDGIVIFCSAKDAGRQFKLLELRLE